MAIESAQLPILFFCIPSPKRDHFAAAGVQNTNAQLRGGVPDLLSASD